MIGGSGPPANAAEESPAPLGEEQNAEVLVEFPTEIPSPTKPPTPTDTPAPTNTPEPTKTPVPTSTPTPTREPIFLSGSGDSVVDLDKWNGAALAHITYTGSSNFAVWNYGFDGERINLLVNIIGEYEGTRALDFRDDEDTVRFVVESSGPWTIEVRPFGAIRSETIPSVFSGVGDDVVFICCADPDTLIIDATNADSNFAIWGYGDTIDLLVNEIAPYSGVVIVGRGISILEIKAEGPWTIEVTAR